MRNFTLNELPDQIDPNLLKKVQKCETATIGHFMHGCFMSRNLQPLDKTRRIAGTAVTLKIAGPDSALLHHIISELRDGDVLIIDRCGDTNHACLGGGVALAASVRNIEGVIIDGPITDQSEIAASGLAVWSLGASPITTKLLGLAGEFNTDISVGGITVHPGDVIIADESGVLAIDPLSAEQVANQCLKMQEEEAYEQQKIREGAKLGELSGASRMILNSINSQSLA